MRPLKLLPFLAVLPFLHATVVPAAETILDANFNDKSVGVPIGTGGSAVGEPFFVSTTISAVIQEFPLATPNLKINDSDLYDAGYARFGFLHDWLIDSGIVTISFTIRFQAYEDYIIRVRERRANSRKFLDLSFGSSTNIWYTDDDTATPTAIGNYQVDHDYTMVLTFDMDAGTYSVQMDGATLLADEPHSVVYGMGAVWFGQAGDEDDDGEYNIDDLLITATVVPTAVTPATWAGTKAAWR